MRDKMNLHQVLECMHGWIEGWMDGWMDRWMDVMRMGNADEYEWMHGCIVMDEWMDGWTDGGM